MKAGKHRPEGVSEKERVVLLRSHVEALIRAFHGAETVFLLDESRSSKKARSRLETDVRLLKAYHLVEGEAEPYSITKKGVYFLARALRGTFSEYRALLTVEEIEELRVGDPCPECQGDGSCKACSGWGEIAGAECRVCLGDDLCPYCEGEGWTVYPLPGCEDEAEEEPESLPRSTSLPWTFSRTEFEPGWVSLAIEGGYLRIELFSVDGILWKFAFDPESRIIYAVYWEVARRILGHLFPDACLKPEGR